MSVVWVFFLLCYYFRVLLKYVSDTTCILYACCLWFRPINFQLHSVYNCKYQSNSSWLDCAFILINRTFSLSLSFCLSHSSGHSVTVFCSPLWRFTIPPLLFHCWFNKFLIWLWFRMATNKFSTVFTVVGRFFCIVQCLTSAQCALLFPLFRLLASNQICCASRSIENQFQRHRNPKYICSVLQMHYKFSS